MQGDKFYSLSELGGGPPLLSSNINSLLFSNWATWDIIAKWFERMRSLFQPPFKGRRGCRIVRSLLGRLRVRDLT